MKRSLLVWLTFLACLAVVLAAAGWISITALRLDRSEAEARALGQWEEDVRLALWRLDSYVAPLVAQEHARPYFVYSAFYPADRGYGRMLVVGNKDAAHSLLLPSPLLLQRPPHVKLHFQVDASGGLTSPQVPPEEQRAQAEAWADSAAWAAEQQSRASCLAELDSWLDRQCVAQHLPTAGTPGEPSPQWAQQLAQSFAQLMPPPAQQRTAQQPATAAQTVSDGETAPQRAGNQALPLPAGIPTDPYAQQSQPGRGAGPEDGAPLAPENTPSLPQQRADINVRNYGPQREQRSLNDLEFAARQLGFAQMAANTTLSNALGHLAEDADIGPMTALWLHGELLLARRVRVGGQELLQGAWLDWESLRQTLLSNIEHLFPEADLQPVAVPDDAATQRRLAVLPVRLDPGPMPAVEMPLWTPLRVSLAVAWGGMLLAAAATAALLLGVMRLSERRATFVSAVTHELRTPLTTFRMYSEMLEGGMVASPSDQRQYLATLRREADRLTHLVENVLGYARLQRAGRARRVQQVALGELLQQVAPRLEARVAQTDLTLHVELPDALRAIRVAVDPAAVEQVLLNLVDNACKYAACSAPAPIEMFAAAAQRHVMLYVRDRGPGVDRRVRRRLFRPFSKSAEDAAATAAGVGLGLAFSRRVARSWGGDLWLHDGETPGACFALRLPRG
jgi:signal transduction histidine kinase